MYVIPGARGQGVGRRLLAALEDKARSLGYDVARLDTGPAQPGAQALYQSQATPRSAISTPTLWRRSGAKSSSWQGPEVVRRPACFPASQPGITSPGGLTGGGECERSGLVRWPLPLGCCSWQARLESARGAGSYRLTATNNGANYAPTFTGNGMLGVRVPDVGQGYAGGQVPAQSELAGFYAQPPGDVQQRANIPTWSTLGFSDGGQTFL